MARKANRAAREANAAKFGPWRESVSARLLAVGKPERTRYILGWCDDIRQYIDAGDLGPCTQALIASVCREVAAWETGYYERVVSRGGVN